MRNLRRASSLGVLAAALCAAQGTPGSVRFPQLPPPPPPAPVEQKIPRQEIPPPGERVIRGVTQEVEGQWRRLRTNASVETTDILLEAEEIDYNDETGIVEARGRVRFTNFKDGTILKAARVDYNMKDKNGTFYEVDGSTPGKFDARPGLLTTGNPFLFKGEWAEQTGDKYILYKGTLTNCTYPDPWWTLRSPKIDLIPGDRALLDKAIMRLKGVPLLYAPKFYKSLAENPRQSGFLTPNIGNSNRRGFMVGGGYYWAINRSYDVQYRAQYFTQRGLANTADFRARPTQNSDLNFFIYGVADKGYQQDDGTRVKQGGYLFSITGKALWKDGWYSKGNVNYLSSFLFRQSFTESFNEAVFSEVNSIFYTSKDWGAYNFNAVFLQHENFQSTDEGDVIKIRELPRIEYLSRDQQVVKGPLPVWVSWSAIGGLVRRTQPSFQTRQFVERLDVEPSIMTALRWKDIHLIPSFTLHETYYGSSYEAFDITGGSTPIQVVGQGINRFAPEFRADLIFPSIARIYEAPRWMGKEVKHAIEPRAFFRGVTGVNRYRETIRFDAMELLSSTSEAQIGVTNRVWTKGRDNIIRDFLTWDLSMRYFFMPDFGGAVVANRRNVIESSAEMTAYTFFAGPRRYSPVVSSLRAQPLPAFGLEYRTDFDPLIGKITNSTISTDARFKENYLVSLGYNMVACVPFQSFLDAGINPCARTPQPNDVLSPPSNQIRGLFAWGRENKRGWNAGFLGIYDWRVGVLQFANTQVTYNTDCCAFQVQYRRFNFGTRNENQFRLAFVVANIGSFGTLRRQERLF